jgi:putative transposase
MLCGTLRFEGWKVNHRKVYRLYKEEKFELRCKGKKRLKSELRGEVQKASAPNQLWIRPRGTRTL